MSKDMHIPNPDYMPVPIGSLLATGFDLEGNYQEFLEPKGVRRIYENGKEVFTTHPIELPSPIKWRR